MAKLEPARKRRRWRLVLGASLLFLTAALGAFVIALPWLLGTPPARAWMLRRSNQVMAPAGFQFETIRFSWFGPTRLRGFTLLDPQGDRVVFAKTATWRRNLWQVLFRRPVLGTLVLERAALDIERARDGTVDLAETIKPLLGLNPKTDLTIVVDRGTLKFRDASQPVPVEATEADVTIAMPPRPGPVDFRVRLANPSRTKPVHLTLQGSYRREPTTPGTLPDLNVELEGQKWPWTITVGEVVASGALDGGFKVRRQEGLWTSSGDLAVLTFDAAGPRLAGDHLSLDRLAAAWDVRQSSGGWAFRRLDVTSPVGAIQAVGTWPAAPDATTRLDATLDLAALARQLPHALRLRDGLTLERGAALVWAESKQDAWEVEARLSDLSARDAHRAFTLKEPATLSARLAPRAGGSDLAVERFALRAAGFDATGRGDFAQGVDWSGTLDLGGFQRQFGDLIDFGALRLAGGGEFSGRYRGAGGTFENGLKGTLRRVEIEGLASEPFRRESIGLDLALSGPATASGLPSGWKALKVKLTSDGLAADLSAQAPGTLTLAARVPFTLDETKRKADGRLVARWDETKVTIDELRLALDPGGASAPLALAATGTFDRASGTLALAPPARPAGPLALAPDGVHISGIGRGGTLKGRAGLVGDLAALRRVGLDRMLGDLSGRWALRTTFEATDEGLKVGAGMKVADLARPDGADGSSRRVEGPVELALNAVYHDDSERLDLRELVLISPFGTLQGSGRVDDLRSRRLADLRGQLGPDWEAINRRLAATVEPGARVAGKARAWSLKGPLSGDSLGAIARGLDAELGVDLIGADIYGMRLGPTPVVVSARGGKVGLGTIDTTLNEGRIHLEPKLDLDDPKGAAVTLGPESSVTDATINEEVSHRVLSFVAPVLDNATRVHGRVSLDLGSARFPIGGDAAKTMTVDGDLVFQDVEFIPGPLAADLLALVGREGRPLMKLDEPIDLRIADRRVYQRGLALPLGKVARIELDGWVDFDRNLALTASLPVTPGMVGNRPLLSDIVEGTKISVPIRGTLQKPEIDRDVMSQALANLGKTLLERGIGRGAAELLLKMTQPRDPNAPRPPTLRERRLERQMERQRRREGMP